MLGNTRLSIIEQVADWPGPTGGFVEAAIESGFFTLAPLDSGQAELILNDFFPANHGTARTPEALEVLRSTDPADIQRAFRWFVANRQSREIPPRIDFILDRFPDFIAKARKDFP